MKKTIFVTVLILVAAMVAIAVYGNIRESNAFLTGAAVSSASVVNGKEQFFEPVDLGALDKTGICADRETTKAEEECKNSRQEEELMIDSLTSVIFQSVCETGLDEVETGLTKTKSYPYSVRKTLNVFLEDKRSKKRELIKSISCNYAFDKYPVLHKPECYDFPYILDAEAANDGSLIRFLVKDDRDGIAFYQYDIRNRNWNDRLEDLQYFRFVFEYSDSPSSGRPYQAYFVLPDVINVKCGAGREYSAEIAFEDKPIYYHTGNRFFEPGPEKIIKNAIVFRCVYWNKKGSYDFIKCLFLKQGRYDKSLGSFTSEDTVPETVKDTPPIPTEKAWEGWHKLTISARQ